MVKGCSRSEAAFFCNESSCVCFGAGNRRTFDQLVVVVVVSTIIHLELMV